MLFFEESNRLWNKSAVEITIIVHLAKWFKYIILVQMVVGLKAQKYNVKSTSMIISLCTQSFSISFRDKLLTSLGATFTSWVVASSIRNWTGFPWELTFRTVSTDAFWDSLILDSCHMLMSRDMASINKHPR